MNTLNSLDMDRIFAETEAGVRARAQLILQEAAEDRADPQLAERRKIGPPGKEPGKEAHSINAAG